MAREIYADRAYDDTGNLVSRKLPGAVLHDPEEAAARVQAMVREGAIISNSGKRIPVAIDTVCVHGDNPVAVAVAPDGRTAYVGNYNTSLVTPINVATGIPGPPIRTSRGPCDFAFSPDGRTAYVVSQVAGTVTPISTATNRPGKPIKAGTTPITIAITPAGRPPMS